MTTGTKSASDPQSIAISALAFIASDEVLLKRFLAISGIDADQIRLAAREPGFLAGVLQFLLAHEPTLMQFCGACDVAPEAVGSALRHLPFGNDRHDGST